MLFVYVHDSKQKFTKLRTTQLQNYVRRYFSECTLLQLQIPVVIIKVIINCRPDRLIDFIDITITIVQLVNVPKC